MPRYRKKYENLMGCRDQAMNCISEMGLQAIASVIASRYERNPKGLQELLNDDTVPRQIRYRCIASQGSQGSLVYRANSIP